VDFHWLGLGARKEFISQPARILKNEINRQKYDGTDLLSHRRCDNDCNGKSEKEDDEW
jgi:hypothetical protein